MANSTANVPSVQVRRTIRAPQQRVFDAWTKPQELKAWHAPGPLIVAPDGAEHRVSGVYREIDPPRKVVYTWSWEGDHPVKDSVVTIEFFARGDATEVVLTHAGIVDEVERGEHEQGWEALMDKLDATYSARLK